MYVIAADNEAVKAISIYTITCMSDSGGAAKRLKIDRISNVIDVMRNMRRYPLGITTFNFSIQLIIGLSSPESI